MSTPELTADAVTIATLRAQLVEAETAARYLMRRLIIAERELVQPCPTCGATRGGAQ